MKRVTQAHAVAQPTRISNLGSGGPYRQQWQPVRQGASDHEKVPSRMAGERVYRDGRREAV
jgi:hypothetical protein